VSRLTLAGLTTRMRSRPDARGAVAVFTPAGAAMLNQTRAAHLTSIRRHIFERLGDLDLAAFTSGMESIADSVLPVTASAQRSRSHDAAP
jgi:hypothetical protein